MIGDLANRSCVPCRGNSPPLDASQVQQLLERLGSPWRVVDNHHLEREFLFKDFREALAFANAAGAIAESENHHPDILTSWGKSTVRIWTHAIDGLTENDFILAAKIEHQGSSARCER